MQPPTPDVDTEFLVRRLLQLLDPCQPCLYGVSRRRRLARHPIGRLDDLVGWTAPSCWTAAALVAPATAVGPDGTTDIGLLHLVTRGGYSVSARRHEERVDLLSNGTGPIDDLCHRIVGLDTRPPDSPVRGFLDTLWLDRVLGMALDRPLGTRGPTLRQVLALRPDGLDWSASGDAASSAASSSPASDPPTPTGSTTGPSHDGRPASCPTPPKPWPTLRNSSRNRAWSHSPGESDGRHEPANAAARRWRASGPVVTQS